MTTGDVREFVNTLAVIPGYNDLFARKPTLEELIRCLKKYPVTEWLSYLARIQNMLGADRSDNEERMRHVLFGALSPEIIEKLKDFQNSLKNPSSLRLFYERQLSTLQQLAILYAPESGAGRLAANDGRHDLGIALLMTMDLMGKDRSISDGSLLPIIIQDQIRMSITPAPVFAARSLRFYELFETNPTPEVSEYLSLFEKATNVNAIDFILGGIAVAISEDYDPNELAECWTAIHRPHQCKNPKEAKVRTAYETVRMRSISNLKALIKHFEKDNPPRDWNLIALSQAPICNLGKMGAYVLNHTALGRSLFDGVRHTVLTAAVKKSSPLPPPYNNSKAIGQLYGKVFENYVQYLLETYFPGQVYRIPEHKKEKRADLLIWFPNKVLIIEVKGVHFVGLRHAAFLSIEQRRNELEAIGFPNAIKQIAATILNIRDGKIKAPSMPSYDWTITPIIPVIVTEEQMPLVPGCWDAFYKPFCRPLDEMENAGPINKLRLLTVTELERIQDYELPYDFATTLTRWAADPKLAEVPWDCFVSIQRVTRKQHSMLSRFGDTIKLLASKLGIDQSLIRPVDEENRH